MWLLHPVREDYSFCHLDYKASTPEVQGQFLVPGGLRGEERKNLSSDGDKSTAVGGERKQRTNTVKI